MRSYSEVRVFSARALSLRTGAHRLVERVPDPIDANEDWRCHELARAIGSLLRLDVVDGKFGGVDHSWLLVPDGCLDRHVAFLDVYAVGSIPQVRLVDPRSPEGLLFEGQSHERQEIRYVDVAAITHVLDPCSHEFGFLGQTPAGDRFCGLCGEFYS